MLLLTAPSTLAAVVRSEGIKVVANGAVRPFALPRTDDAPITLSGSVRISTDSGAPPPVLESIKLELDRHGSLDTVGLPVCTAGRLQATNVSQARKACSNAIVGEGVALAVLHFPDQMPVHISSPLTFFNGPDRHGDHTLLVHAYTTSPVPATFVVPIVIEPINRGELGYRVKADVPKIAGGDGTLLGVRFSVGRRWTYRGRRHSYVNARCEIGFFEAIGELRFANGYILNGPLFVPCGVRHG
ncbi:MAG: hypothetical protein ACRDLL_02990 [Solirubrobacterales bacterium]